MESRTINFVCDPLKFDKGGVFFNQDDHQKERKEKVVQLFFEWEDEIDQRAMASKRVVNESYLWMLG